MAKEFTSEKLVVLSGPDSKKPTKHTFNHVIENATDDQIIQFGKIVETLSGEAFQAANVTTVSKVTA